MFDRFSDRVGDLIVGSIVTFVVFVWIALQLAVVGTDPIGLSEPLGWAATVIACAALFFRNTFPLTVTFITLVCSIVYYPASSIDGPVLVTYVVALFTLAARGHVVAAWSVTSVSFAALIIPEWISGFVHMSVVETYLLAGWFVAIVAFGSMVASHRAYRAQAETAIREGERRSVAEERLRIARELHDAVGHHLSLINVQTSAALRKLKKNPTYSTEATLGVIAETSQLSLRELRAMVGVLREAGVDSPTGPGPSLEQLPPLVAAAESAGIEVVLRRDGRAELPVAVDAAAFRVAQEALTNVVRHAGARHVEVDVVIGTSTLALRIADDGDAKGGKPIAGNGLTGMRERAESLGGTFDAGPREDGGFIVEATWPLEVQS
ncbi:sensor histidine kinase [Glycomyces buryatensis]|uniref:histidine kinase n=1 Tax=Glycomyces buryatensis TaxID=2570927 RepID=A0A4S8QLW8_9ACTN|nr:sensor histidine kinase [Glycomyces buryatensis]THV41734.1 sensor histidine kinase [Glycomyces buryatensis]